MNADDLTTLLCRAGVILNDLKALSPIDCAVSDPEISELLDDAWIAVSQLQSCATRLLAEVLPLDTDEPPITDEDTRPVWPVGGDTERLLS